MLAPGPAKKVTIHLNENTAAQKDFLSREIVTFLYTHDVSGATVIRPAAGFGSHHRLHKRGSGIDADHHMPVQIEFIESAEKVNEILPLLHTLVVDGVIEAQDTTILKIAQSDPETAPADETM